MASWIESLLPQGLAEALGSLLVFVDAAAPFAFALVLLIAIHRVRTRALSGQAYLENLEDRVEAIKVVSLDLGDDSEPTASSLAMRLDDILGRAETHGTPDLDQAVIELRNGLTTYLDNLSIRSNGHIVAHIRIADLFSAQLPDRFIAAPRAMAASRFSVQAGLAFSVFFIILALINLGNNSEVITSVTYKFIFTIMGLVVSLWIQFSMGRATRKARQRFVIFEDALEEAIKSDVVSPLAGSFRLLEHQTKLNLALRSLLEGFKGQVKELSHSATVLERSANSATKTIEMAQEASVSIGTEIETRLKELLEQFDLAQERFLTGLDEHAGKATKGYTRAIGLAARTFNKQASEGGTSFKSGMSELASDFRGQITAAGSNLQENIIKASDTLGGTAAQAGNRLDAGVTAALSRFSKEFTTAAESYSKGASESGTASLEAVRLLTKALEELNRSLRGAQTSFEKFGELQVDRIRKEVDVALSQLEKKASIEVKTEPIDWPQSDEPAESSAADPAQSKGDADAPAESSANEPMQSKGEADAPAESSANEPTQSKGEADAPAESSANESTQSKGETDAPAEKSSSVRGQRGYEL